LSELVSTTLEIVYPFVSVRFSKLFASSTFFFSISRCRTRVKSTSCRRVLSSSFIAIAVGSGIILDNFTASRGDSEKRRPMEGFHKWNLHRRRLWKVSFFWNRIKRLSYLWYHGLSMRRTILPD